MQKYSIDIIENAKNLRLQGKTYREICTFLNINPTKSTLSFWFRTIQMNTAYYERISLLNKNHLQKVRLKAIKANKNKKEKLFNELNLTNSTVVKSIHNKDVAKIALAMLCLGEASKYNPKTNNAFYFGNSNPKIVLLFLNLLKICFSFKNEKIRCTVLCRADQNVQELENYWMKITNIQKNQFYKTRIDSRTIGKPTLKKDYKGVLRVDYFDNKVRLELESLSELVYNELSSNGLVA